MVKLEEVCSSIIRGPFGSALKKEFFVQKSKDSYKVYEQKHAIKKEHEIGEYYIDEHRYNQLSRFKVRPNDIIISCSGTIGEMFQLPQDCEEGVINQALLKLTLKDTINSSFFQYFWKSSIKTLNSRGSGIKNISSVKHIRKMKIPLPPLKEQKHVSDILDKTQEIINSYKRRFEELDKLNTAIFNDMFGDIRDNKFKKKTLPKLVKNSKYAIKRGPFGGSLKKKDFVESGYLIYEQRHAIHNDFEYEKYYITQEKYDNMIAFMVQPRDLIISCSGTLGRIAEIPPNAKKGVINQALLKLTLDENIMNNIFFMNLFRHDVMQDIIFGISCGSGIANFPSMKIIKNIDFITPPIELQNKFAAIATKIEEQKSIVKQSITESENLFNSLMSKYFD